MKEKARVLVDTDLVASPDEVQQAIASLTEAELVKLRRMAEGASFRLRRKVWGTGANDILQEATLRVLEEKRHWKPQKVDFVGLLAGIIASIESAWRKRGKRGETPVLESDLPATNSDGETVPTVLQQAADHRPTPERQLIESEALTQEQLLQQIEELFSEDSLAALIFSEWQRGTNGPEIMKALDLTRQDYDTAVRRMDRAIAKRWPEGMPYVR
jgi:DNA-directed RNA polymerase specialized sigma24 family protein